MTFLYDEIQTRYSEEMKPTVNKQFDRQEFTPVHAG